MQNNTALSPILGSTDSLGQSMWAAVLRKTKEWKQKKCQRSNIVESSQNSDEN